MHLAHIALLVEEYDEAIEWLTRCLDFKLVEDTPIDGKRWIMMQPQGGGCTFVLGRAKNTRQRIGVGNQFAGRVGFFLHTSDFDTAESRLRQNKVRIVREPEDHPYGKVLVFKDKWGNMWDLIQPSDKT